MLPEIADCLKQGLGCVKCLMSKTRAMTNAGIDETQARVQAQVAADRQGVTMVLYRQGGTWWIARLSDFGQVPQGSDVIRPSI